MNRRRPFPTSIRQLLRYKVPFAIFAALLGIFASQQAFDAYGVGEPIYTLPFVDSYSISCGFGCYAGHAGVDYEVGEPGVARERVVARRSPQPGSPPGVISSDAGPCSRVAAQGGVDR